MAREPNNRGRRERDDELVPAAVLPAARVPRGVFSQPNLLKMG